MPNYSFVTTSRFKPYSFKELLEPFALYREDYREQQDALTDLDTKASIWENMINKEQDPELYAQYQDYANKLKAQADIIATEGLNPTSRQAMLNLKSRYSKDIVPIEQAFSTRKEQVKAQQQALMQNPSLMFSRIASNTKLLDYVNNPELGFETINGDQVTQRVFQQATALSKELIDSGKEELRKVLGGDYYEYVKQRGFTREAVLAAIMNSPDASPVLQKLVEDAVETTGVRGWNNQDMLDRVTSYAQQGLWGAVGTTETQLVTNWREQEKLRHSNNMKEISARTKAEKDSYLYPFKTGDKIIYYNARIGMYQDENGNLVEAPNNSPLKVGTNRPKEAIDKLANVGSIAEMAKLHYKPQAVITQSHGGEGKWQAGVQGEDIDGGGSPSHFSTSYSLFDRSNFELYKPRDIENMTFSYLPPDYDYSKEVRDVIYKKLTALGYTVDDLDNGDVAIVMTNRRPGNIGNDYVIYAKK